MKYFGGIDIGSTTIKIVLIDDRDQIVADVTCPTGSHFHKNTMAAFEVLLADTCANPTGPLIQIWCL